MHGRVTAKPIPQTNRCDRGREVEVDVLIDTGYLSSIFYATTDLGGVAWAGRSAPYIALKNILEEIVTR